MQICFATNNIHKIDEAQRLLGNGFQVITLKEIGCTEELREDQPTLEGNSFQKADYVFNKYNVPTFADDSGLEVAALNGAPGVYSARYAGPQRNHGDNMDLLLKNLDGHTDRRAQFRAVLTLLAPSLKQQFEGIVKGTIQEQ